MCPIVHHMYKYIETCYKTNLLSLPYTHILFKFNSNKFTPLIERKRSLFYWWMNFNLSHVCIPAILMVTNHCYLNHKCSYRFVSNVFNWNHYPSCWFIQEHYIEFFQVIEVCSYSNWQPVKNTSSKLLHHQICFKTLTNVSTNKWSLNIYTYLEKVGSKINMTFFCRLIRELPIKLITLILF